MICKKPYFRGKVPFGCGQCLPCRINRGRQWTWRQYLESLCHDRNCFVTLTYSNTFKRPDDPLDKKDLQLFLKRFRKAIAPLRVRYFAVGEYGDESGRPHYHLSLFGVQGLQMVDVGAVGEVIGETVIKCKEGERVFSTIEFIVNQSWGRGITHVAEFNEATAAYCCGYITKKLRDRTEGVVRDVPEFARMSNRPGLGAPAVGVLARSLSSNYHAWETGDVPVQLRLGKRSIPLPRYLLAKLRSECGFSEEYIKALRDAKTYTQTLELSAVFQNSPNFSVSEAYRKKIEGRLAQTEARYNIWKSRRGI